MKTKFRYFNPKYTEIKLETLKAILDTLCQNIKTIIDEGRHDSWRETFCLFFDGNAGPGSYIINDKKENGSPLIFLNIAERLRLPYRALLCEKETEFCQELAENLGLEIGYKSVFMDSRFGSSNIYACDKNFLFNHRQIKSNTIFNDKNTNVLSSLINFSKEYNCKKMLGLLYFDPNGSDIPYQQLAEMSKMEAFHRTDILIHVSARNIKRAHTEDKEFIYLSDKLESIEKNNWLIRFPMGQHQWAFLLGTNWNSFPVMESIGFYRFDSKEGRQLFEHVNFTKKEILTGKAQEIAKNSKFFKKFCGV